MAYPAAPDPEREPVPPHPLGPRQISSRQLGVTALRHLLTEAQISFWECAHFWGSTQAAETAILRATEACDNYLLVLSPAALTDDCCLQGLLFALSMNKRILPIMAEPVAPDQLPEPLHALAMLDLPTPPQPLSQTPQGRQIVARLHHEADYHQAHTHLLTRALEWERHQRDPGLLLQGADLVWYQRWLVGAKARSHYGPIYLQNLYVAESARHSEQPSLNQSLDWVKRWLQK